MARLLELWRNRGRVKRLAGPGRSGGVLKESTLRWARWTLWTGFPLDMTGRCLLNFGCGPPSLSLTHMSPRIMVHG